MERMIQFCNNDNNSFPLPYNIFANVLISVGNELLLYAVAELKMLLNCRRETCMMLQDRSLYTLNLHLF